MSEAEGATANQEDLPGELEGEEDKLKQKKRNEPHRLKFWAKYKIGKGTSLLEKSGRPLGKLRCLVLRRQHAAYSYLRPEFLHYFERSLRPFGHKTHANISAAHSKRRTNNMRTLAFKLKKRALNWMPLSRQPPFHCSKCGLMSRRLRMMDKHVCAKRGPDYKNVAQTVELGFRSRAKDALAVLERISRPQAQSVRLSKYEKMCIPSNSSNTLSQEVLGDEPKTLCEIAWNSVQKMYGLDREFKRIRTTVASTSSADNDHHLCQSSSRADTPANITAIPTATVNIRMPNTFQQTEKQQQEQNIPKGIVYFCRHCSRLFSKYADWDGHLEKDEEGCQILGGSEPMEIRMLANECLHAPSPPTVSRQPAFTSSPSTAAETDGSTDEHHGPWQCTKCSTGEFLTRTEFHTHLLKCALLEMDAKNGMGNGRMPMAYGESHLMNTNDEYGKAGSKTKRTRR